MMHRHVAGRQLDGNSVSLVDGDRDLERQYLISIGWHHVHQASGV